MSTESPSSTDAYAPPPPSDVGTPRSSAFGKVVQTVRQKRTFIATVGFAFGVVGLQLGQGILLARLLGAEGRGEYATAVLYVQMLLYVGLFGGLEVICRYAADSNTGDPASKADQRRFELRRAALRLGVATGLITTLIVLFLSVVGLPAEKRFLMPLALLCGLSIVGQHVMLIMTAVDRGSGQFNAYNWRKIFAAAAFPALLLLSYLIWKVTLTIACVLFVVASILSMAVCVVGVPQAFRGESQPKVKQLLKESRPYGFSMLATDLFERLDLLLVMWLTPLITQGYYAAMVPVAYPLTVIPNTLGLFLFNRGADSNRTLTKKDFNRILGISLAVQFASVIPFVVVIGPLVRWVYGEDFAPAVTYAYWLAPVSALKGVLQGLDSYVKGRGRPMASVSCRVVAAVLMVVVTFALIGQYGAIAIAIAALAGQLLCLIWISGIVYADIRSQEPASN